MTKFMKTVEISIENKIVANMKRLIFIKRATLLQRRTDHIPDGLK